MIKLFEKKLSSTDVDKRLAVPTSSLWAFDLHGAEEVWFSAINGGMILEFCCRNRPTPEGHTRLELFGDWRRFVASKQLRAGDRVVLYKREHEAEAEAPFIIEAQRKLMIRLLGEDIWAWVTIN
ncbi:hypothetical protein CCACVL1_01888 [Corchorus capsularis]|uniref:TF-B3 domain-containing protein n=1 Tax=Corchorus capsularis TaxID=210143 RepID=A0A1R3KEE5_COCAP|nr:hypothetical protein CCACVL1_01888 [Corchorus capsularis]